MHGTKSFWYPIQVTQYTYYNLSMWDCFRPYKKHSTGNGLRYK